MHPADSAVAQLSEAAWSVWGKTDQGARFSSHQDGWSDGQGWLPLVQHLEDSRVVAAHLWETWVPGVVRRRLAEALGSEQGAAALYYFLAATHDIGKCTPAFAQLAHDVGRGELVAGMERAGLRSPRLGRQDRHRHTVTGEAAVRRYLVERWSFPVPRASAVASVTGSHHGLPQVDNTLASHLAQQDTSAMGDKAWEQVRIEILDTMVARTGVAATLESLRDVAIPLTSLIDLTALVVMADWIASDTKRFPYDLVHAEARGDHALTDLDLRSPWEPPLAESAAPLFVDRFPGVGTGTPTPLQQAAVGAASAAAAAPLLLIEAPTGAGKTEAALLAAEVLAARFGAGGVYVGLPTMATSNAMFGRVLRWVDQWPAVHDPSLWLAHGKAALNDQFSSLVSDGRFQSVHDEDESPGEPAGATRVSSWLQGRHKGLLANVVVGTIDQVLMGALQVRHLALRHLALSGKVVVVDEVHAADTWMRSYLVRMLEYLGSYSTPVILLSATLPPDHRSELVAAYERGRRNLLEPPVAQVRRRRRGLPTLPASGDGTDPTFNPSGPGPDDYPLVTVADSEVRHHTVQHDTRRFEIHLACLDEGLDVLVEAVAEAIQDGGCVGVIRNTVRRAQEAFDALRDRFGDVVELYHSRFLAADRAARERHLVSRLGPPGGPAERPSTLVVVGTQVLEQSLDIDLDLLVTDLAPIDLVLQRIGRLHRHKRDSTARPARLAVPRCIITGVETWKGTVPAIEPTLTMVNSEAYLLRSLAVLRPHLDGEPLLLPHQGPHLVHRAYNTLFAPPEGWAALLTAADAAQDARDEVARRGAAFGQVVPPWQKNALTGWLSTPADDSREEVGRAQVRDSEDGIEVILLRRDSAGALRLLDGDFPGAGEQVKPPPDDGDPLIRQLAACTVNLPQSLTTAWRWEKTVEELELNGVADDWQHSRWLSGQLVLALGPDRSATLNGHRVTYDSARGLAVTPLPKEMES